MEGLWPTPTVKGNHNRAGITSAAGDGLATAVLWPTPRASDDRSAGTSIERQGHGGHSLCIEVKSWPAPCATDHKGAGPGQRRGQLGEAAGAPYGPLNPAWVEALMGWPMGWTDPEAVPVAIPGWVMGRGVEQHPWEPPRMVPARSVPHRPDRIRMCGNGVVPQVAAVAGARIELAVGLRRAS